MTTQYLQKCPQIAVLDEYSGWFDRLLARAADWLEIARCGLARKTLLRDLRKLSSRQLRDVGLDDPARQRQLVGTYLETDGNGFESLRYRYLARH